jgi:hypothetical protein
MKINKSLMYIVFWVSFQSLLAQLPSHKTPCTAPVFTDDFSSWTWSVYDVTCGNGWIQPWASSLYFDNDENYQTCFTCSSSHGLNNGRPSRAFKTVYSNASSLNNSTWRTECRFKITDGNGPGHMLIGVTSGNDDPQGSWFNCSLGSWSCSNPGSCNTYIVNSNQDGIFASLIAFGANQIPYSHNDQLFSNHPNVHGGVQDYDATHSATNSNPTNMGWRIYGHAKEGNGVFYPSNHLAASNTNAAPLNTSKGIEIPRLNTDYWLRLERISGTVCQISIFSDPAMTQHVTGSPQCFNIDENIQNLNTLMNSTMVSGDVYRSASGTLDDVKVFDNCPGLPTLTISANPNPVCEGMTATLTATPGFPNYAWFFPYTATTTNTVSYRVYNDAVYGVAVLYPGTSCPVTSTVSVITTTCTDADARMSGQSILQSLNNSFIIYPNPTTGLFTVMSDENQTFEVYNSMGQKIIKTSSDKKIVIDLSDQPSGIYILKAGKTTKKIVKE